MTRIFTLTAVLFVVLSHLLFPVPVEAGKYKVLVVMSYEQENPWCKEIKDGIDSMLSDTSEITYFYMDTKNDLEGGKKKAGEAYALFQKLRPDGIITVDDNAQWMFVEPFLKGTIAIPVMFCGVNEDPQKYGYPTLNISGVLERGHIREGLAFTKQLYPSLNKVIILAKDSPSGRALKKQVQSESDSYVAQVSGIRLVESVRELMALKDEFNESDALFIDSIKGIVDENGTLLSNAEIIHTLSQIFAKPIIGANLYHVEQGALCAVVKTGQEQGTAAADLLLKAMQGTPVSEIPITKNYKGKRVINVTTMKSLGINPRPIVLLGAKLIKTEKL